MKPANYGPVYAAAMYPELCEIFRKNGYALAVHGSLARDFDLIAIPWAEKVSSVEKVLKDVINYFAIEVIGSPENKNHGRIAYTISCGFGNCVIDLSFFPLT